MTIKNPSLSAPGYQLLPIPTGDNREFHVSDIFRCFAPLFFLNESML